MHIQVTNCFITSALESLVILENLWRTLFFRSSNACFVFVNITILSEQAFQQTYLFTKTVEPLMYFYTRCNKHSNRPKLFFFLIKNTPSTCVHLTILTSYARRDQFNFKHSNDFLLSRLLQYRSVLLSNNYYITEGSQ